MSVMLSRNMSNANELEPNDPSDRNDPKLSSKLSNSFRMAQLDSNSLRHQPQDPGKSDDRRPTQ